MFGYIIISVTLGKARAITPRGRENGVGRGVRECVCVREREREGERLCVCVWGGGGG